MKRAQKNHHERTFSSTLKTVKLYRSKYRYFMKKTGWKKTGIYIMTRRGYCYFVKNVDKNLFQFVKKKCVYGSHKLRCHRIRLKVTPRSDREYEKSLDSALA